MTIQKNTDAEIEIVPVSPAELMSQAIGQLASAGDSAPQMVEALEKLVGLQERQEDRQAQKDFYAALARFQSQCPEVTKNATAEKATGSGFKKLYTYAKLDHIRRTIRPLLTECGFSYGWDESWGDGYVEVTCTLRHAAGHSEKSTHRSQVDHGNRMMSAPQKGGSAVQYGRRNSLVDVLGIDTADEDDDGANAANEGMSREQVANLEALATETPGGLERLLQYCKTDDLSKVPAGQYAHLVAVMETARAEVAE